MAMRAWRSGSGKSKTPWKKSVKPKAASGVKRALTVKGSYGGSPEAWHEIRRAVYKRDNYTCRRCKRHVNQLRDGEYLNADHIVRISRGGTDALSNLQTLCTTCHAKRYGHSHLRRR